LLIDLDKVGTHTAASRRDGGEGGNGDGVARDTAMKALTLGILWTIVTAFAAHAGDVGSTVAALSTPDAECRYYKSLCDEVHEADAVTQQRTDESRAALEALQAKSFYSGSERDAVGAKLAEAKASLRFGGQKWLDVQEAERVIKAKHDKLPACFEECQRK
jgi:hypothetical protein